MKEEKTLNQSVLHISKCRWTVTRMNDSKEEIEDHLRKEIQKSGFPLESYCSIILGKREWGVTPHYMYLPAESRDYREIDIFAVRRFEGIGLNALIIECKKQEKMPWVFFEGERSNRDVHTLNVGDPQLYQDLAEKFRNHYYYEKRPCVYHFPCFVQHGKPDVILEAINQVLNALAAHVSREQKMLSQMELQLGSHYQEYQEFRRIFYPVIVLDGKLFRARVHEDGDISLTESDHLQLMVMRALPEADKTIATDIIAFRRSYVIDIVRKGYFNEFLNNFP
jgi:hypothetical protein